MKEKTEEYYYTVLHGARLNLGELTEEQKELLAKSFKMYKNKIPYSDFFNKTFNQESLKIMDAESIKGQFFITPKIIHTVIYQVLAHLAGMLGTEQGYFRGDADNVANERVLEKFL